MNDSESIRTEEADAMERLRQDLRRQIGFDAKSVGETVLDRAVRLRMDELGMKDLEEYLKLVRNSLAHWTELVESILVTETWFFRDPEVFRAFSQTAIEQWLPAHACGRLRILSLACSSGEEPFSAVMALLEAGLPPERFHVDAIDVCRGPIARARKGLYGNNSFRGGNLEFRNRYFRALAPGEFALQPDVQNQVRFYEGNLLAQDFPLGQDSYDFIFCRNLLIYFDRPAQQQALQKVEQLLAPSGLLFVGPAEQALALDLGFVPDNLPRAFICRSPQPAGATARAGARWSGGYAPLSSLSAGTEEETRSHPVRQASLESFLKDAALSVRIPDLEQVRRLADAGLLEEAAEACEEHLRHCGPCAEGYYLLGLVREAQGDVRALESYRKALYLKPGYYEALSHMALLAQRNGDPAGARNFRRRAERSQPAASRP